MAVPEVSGAVDTLLNSFYEAFLNAVMHVLDQNMSLNMVINSQVPVVMSWA